MRKPWEDPDPSFNPTIAGWIDEDVESYWEVWLKKGDGGKYVNLTVWDESIGAMVTFRSKDLQHLKKFMVAIVGAVKYLEEDK